MESLLSEVKSATPKRAINRENDASGSTSIAVRRYCKRSYVASRQKGFVEDFWGKPRSFEAGLNGIRSVEVLLGFVQMAERAVNLTTCLPQIRRHRAQLLVHFDGLGHIGQ